MPTLTTRPAIDVFEKRFRGDHSQEHAILFNAEGKQVAYHNGDIDSVEFSPAELNAACYGLLSHNHPHAKPPSSADLRTAAEYGLSLRAIGELPDGRHVDYMVTMPGPSQQMATRIANDYDNVLEEAEKELARTPLDDRAWERESRHLAVLRLAKCYGFHYRRSFSGSLSEMAGAPSDEQRRLDNLGALEKTLHSQIVLPLTAQVLQILHRHADRTGMVPVEKLPLVRRELDAAVQRLMLGTPLPDGSLAPYLTKDGKVVPHSVYFNVLWTAMRSAATIAVQRHADIMRKHLPRDLVSALEYATVSPFGNVSEADSEIPDPLHEWLGPDEKRLTDRIWNAAGDLRKRLSQFVAGAVASRQRVNDMETPLEAFLQGKGGYEFRRLARSEVSAAGSRADAISAQHNPFVEMYQPFTSPAHNEIDECDDHVAGGPYRRDDAAHMPPYHANCLCGVLWQLVEDTQAVVRTLRDNIASALSAGMASFVDIVGPLSRRFLSLLFGEKV